MKDLLIIVICLIIIGVLLVIGTETGIFDAVSEAFYDFFHPKKDFELPDINFKFMPELEKHVRRCTECNSIITGLDIVIVKDDTKPVGFNEAELFEAIYCEHCGHQNIISKYYRHASDDINLKAQITRKDSKKHELTCNEMREIMGLKPIQSEEIKNEQTN